MDPTSLLVTYPLSRYGVAAHRIEPPTDRLLIVTVLIDLRIPSNVLTSFPNSQSKTREKRLKYYLSDAGSATDISLIYSIFLCITRFAFTVVGLQWIWNLFFFPFTVFVTVCTKYHHLHCAKNSSQHKLITRRTWPNIQQQSDGP